jgi:hypothetical protein
MTNRKFLKLPSTERGSSRTLTDQNNTEGAPGSFFEPGSWVAFSFTLAGAPGRRIQNLSNSLNRARKFRLLTTRTNAEGTPGSFFEPGSWGCLLTLPRRLAGRPMANPNLQKSPRSSDAPFTHSPLKPTRRVPQVRFLNRGLGFASLSVFHIDRRVARNDRIANRFNS